MSSALKQTLKVLKLDNFGSRDKSHYCDFIFLPLRLYSAVDVRDNTTSYWTFFMNTWEKCTYRHLQTNLICVCQLLPFGQMYCGTEDQLTKPLICWQPTQPPEPQILSISSFAFQFLFPSTSLTLHLSISPHSSHSLFCPLAPFVSLSPTFSLCLCQPDTHLEESCRLWRGASHSVGYSWGSGQRWRCR